MNNRIRRQTSPQEEETPPASTIHSPNKFQRTAKRALRTPEETNVTSEISEPLANEPVKSEATEKTKVITRTNRPTREMAKSPAIEESQASKLYRTTSPPETPKQSMRNTFTQPLTQRAETKVR